MSTAQKTFTDQLYAAPPLTLGGSVSEAFFLDFLQREGIGEVERAHALHGYANLLLRSGDTSDAIKLYEEAVRLESENSELRTNYGLALYHQGAIEEALSQFRRSIFLDSSLALPQRYLARIFSQQGDFASATEHLKRYLERNPRDAGALIDLGDLALHRGSQNEAFSAFEQALILEPENRFAQSRIVSAQFSEGERLFRAGEFLEACEAWTGAYKRFPRPFTADQELVRRRRALRDEHRVNGSLAKAIETFQAEFKKSPEDSSIYYLPVVHYLFSVGLVPEGFEHRTELDSEEVRWRESLVKRGDHPYPHFRLALIHLYRGEREKAFQELSISRDRFPHKKQITLKIDELFGLHDLLREVETRRDEYVNMNLSDLPWERAGFTDPFQLRAWRETGLSPEDAAAWRAKNFSPHRASLWHKGGVTPELGILWSEEGFEDPNEVRLWNRGGFTPQEAKRWLELCPLPIEEIVQTRKAGFEDPELAYRWASVLSLPFEAARWHELGFTPEEALEWRETGFTDAHLAARSKAEGQTPASALKTFNDLTSESAKDD